MVTADASGSPLAGICTAVFPTAGGIGIGGPWTASDGTDTAAGLAPGTYRVRFADCVGSIDYANEYYNNKPDFSLRCRRHGGRRGHHLRRRRRHGRWAAPSRDDRR